MHPESARLTFRDMTPDDLDDLASLLGDPEVMTYYPRPKTRAEAARWIDWNLGLYRTHGHGLWLLTTADGGFVGDCGLTPQVVDGVTELEVGYHVRPPLQGRGVDDGVAAAVDRGYPPGGFFPRLRPRVVSHDLRVAEQEGHVVEVIRGYVTERQPSGNRVHANDVSPAGNPSLPARRSPAP